MAKEKKKDKAPEDRVYTTHEDIRVRIEGEFDEKNPAFKHSWIDAQTPKNRMGHNVEVVKKDGEVIPHMGDILVRRPIEAFNERQMRGALKSKQNVERTLLRPENDEITDEDRRRLRLSRVAKPRKPPLEELDELGA